MVSQDKIKWRPLLESDIGGVDRIAREVHPTLPEVFAKKFIYAAEYVRAAKSYCSTNIFLKGIIALSS